MRNQLPVYTPDSFSNRILRFFGRLPILVTSAFRGLLGFTLTIFVLTLFGLATGAALLIGGAIGALYGASVFSYAVQRKRHAASPERFVSVEFDADDHFARVLAELEEEVLQEEARQEELEFEQMLQERIEEEARLEALYRKAIGEEQE